MSASRSLVGVVSDRVIHVSSMLPCSADVAWRHFTNDSLLASWLTTQATVEPVIGGKYELFWKPSSPEDNSTIGCRITAIAEPRLLAFQWRSPVQFKALTNGADPLTHVVVFFLPEGRSTRIDLIHSGWRCDAHWQEACSWQERAWNFAFAELARTVTPNPSIEATS